jgi:hypothetical protein
MIQYEWRNVPFRDHDPIISVEGTHNFRSVYGYPEAAQEHIKATGNLVGVKQFAVQSSTLCIDVDEEKHLDEIEAIIAAQNVGYSVWTTGNRGLHFHIDMEPIESIDLPYSQAEYIRGLGLSKWVDMTIYRHHSIIRTPGAVHATTGKRKEIVRQIDGPMLSINLVQEPEPEFEHHESGDADSIRRFKRNLLQKRGPGQRHMHLYILFESGISAGHDIDTMLDWLHWWNNHQTAPHSADAVYSKWKGFVNGKTQSHKKTFQSKSVLSF